MRADLSELSLRRRHPVYRRLLQIRPKSVRAGRWQLGDAGEAVLLALRFALFGWWRQVEHHEGGGGAEARWRSDHGVRGWLKKGSKRLFRPFFSFDKSCNLPCNS